MINLRFDKIQVIIKHEYLKRVCNRSFLFVCILGPIVLSSLFFIPSILSRVEHLKEKKIAVIDNSNILCEKDLDISPYEFDYMVGRHLLEFKDSLSETDYWGLLYIDSLKYKTDHEALLFSKTEPNIGLVNYISNSYEKEYEKQKIISLTSVENYDLIQSVKLNLSVRTFSINSQGTEKEINIEIITYIGYFLIFLSYFFIIFFGSQLMRGIIEEKRNRVIEIIISSLRPFELMMGKIIGIALVSLTQFFTWILFTIILIHGIQKYISPDIINSFSADRKMEVNEVIQPDHGQHYQDYEAKNYERIAQFIQEYNFSYLIINFLLFFLLGYLFYGAIFASIGSLFSPNTDIQQFNIFTSIPLVIALFISYKTIGNPDSDLSFWASLIPFFSPIVMMSRIIFEIPFWQLILSYIILFVSFIATTFLASKIYRTGILLYGKKITYQEIWKWLKY